MAHRQQDLYEPANPLTTATSLSWPLSILSALLTGVVGMLAAGVVASACVEWYNVSSREGASGYFVIGIALLGFIAGCLLGLITARVVAAGANPGFLKALGRSVAIVAGIAVASGATARLLADVPPELNGETLMLAVEVRWPETQVEPPVAGPDEASLSLHSIPFYSHTVRASDEGPLWVQDARRVDGRWVAPGAVSVFTSRGKRLLVVSLDDKDPKASEAFLVPLPGRPGPRDLTWSEWLPTVRPGTTPLNRLTYRFRVQPISQTVRTETLGDWEVGTSTAGFYRQQVSGRTTHVATAHFTLRHAGTDVSIDGANAQGKIDDVALLGGPAVAFLVHVEEPGSSGRSFLVSADSGRVRTTDIGEAYSGMRGQELTNDTTRFRANRRQEVPSGQVNRLTYEHAGLYLMGDAVVDTRRLTVHHFKPDTTSSPIPSVPPLGISPDERSFVSFANVGYPSEDQRLVVTNFVDDRTYTLPVNDTTMRYEDLDALDPAWLAHHFEWRRGRDGADELKERAHFTPLPFYGTLTAETGGDRSYRIGKGSDALRTALVAFLVAQFQAEPQPADSDAYEYPVKVGDHIVNVAHSSGPGSVIVSMQARGVDTTLVPEIARQFNEALATGKYDSMFSQ